MKKKEKHLIWDLDGTLIDSYSIIVSSLKEALDEININYDKEEIMKYVIEYSVRDFINKISNENKLEVSKLTTRYSELNDSRSEEIKLIKNAKELLEQLSEMGVSNYIYTHKGKRTNSVLERLGIKEYFKDVITSENGFERKPSPEAIIYLINKHKIPKEDTFYIGDRSLDVECANNANIKSVLYLDKFSHGKKSGKEDYIINDLLDLLRIIKN